MKLTGQMIHEAARKASQNDYLTWERLSLKAQEDYQGMANILYAQLFPELITYLVKFTDHKNGAADLQTLVEIIQNGGTEGDYLDIYVQQDDTDDPETVKIIGHTQCYYMQGGIFLQCIEEYGAGIDLHKTLNELASRQASA